MNLMHRKMMDEMKISVELRHRVYRFAEKFNLSDDRVNDLLYSLQDPVDSIFYLYESLYHLEAVYSTLQHRIK